MDKKKIKSPIGKVFVKIYCLIIDSEKEKSKS